MKRESIIQNFSIFAALIFVVLASGCTIGPTRWLYSEEPIRLQKSEVAVIKGWWYFVLIGYGGVDIYSIDGTILKDTKVEVPPGWHELVIRDYRVSFVALYGVLSDRFTQGAFNFEAGHEYKIKGPGIVTPGYKIVDVTTGAIILNLPPTKIWQEFFKRR